MKKQKYFDGPVKLRFSDNYIYSDNPLGESKLKWIHKIIIDKDILLIYTTPRNFMIILQKYCKNEEQFNDIVHYVKEMPGSGKIHDLEKTKFSFYSFLLSIINLFVFIITADSIKQFGSVNRQVFLFLGMLWILTIISAIVGIYFGFKSISKKEKIGLSSFAIIVNLIITFILGTGLYPD